MTDTITLPRTEAESVLLALEDSKTFDDGAAKWDRLAKSINIVRAALAQQAEQVPIKTCRNCTWHYKDYDSDPCRNCERGDNIEDNWVPMSTGQIALEAAPKGGV